FGHSMTCRSEWHAPAPPTLMSTSPGPGSGTSTSRSSGSCCHSTSWYACIAAPRSSHGEHGARADARRAVDLGEPDAAPAGDLPVARVAAQLQNDLVHLAQAGRADRLAVGQAATVGVDREPARQCCRAALDQLLLVAVLAQAG